MRLLIALGMLFMVGVFVGILESRVLMLENSFTEFRQKVEALETMEGL